MAKEIEIEVKKRLLTPEAPEIRQLEQELHALQNKFNEFYSPVGADRLFPDFDALPEIEKEFLQLEREIKYYTELLQFLGPQYEQAKIEEARNVPTVQVLDKAVRPERKCKPKRAIIVTGASFISLFLISLSIIFYKNIKTSN
jgi:capsule polysaccharide export protein KpsE/RkpR